MENVREHKAKIIYKRNQYDVKIFTLVDKYQYLLILHCNMAVERFIY